MNCQIKIKIPSDIGSVVCPNRWILVSGEIKSDEELPKDTLFECGIYNQDGKLLRRTFSSIKSNTNIDVYRKDFTCYPEELDPGREKLLKEGFAELIYEDPKDKEGSIHKASIKAWYSDNSFRTIIGGPTDTAHGAIFNDGLKLVSDDGEALSSLPLGSYRIVVSLKSNDGKLLAEDSKDIKIGIKNDAVICRFNPIEHRRAIEAWAEKMGFGMVNDPVAGYQDPYIKAKDGSMLWLYHMGLLTMYRANDICLYTDGKVHMFVYMMDETSTSYRTELAFLESRNEVGNPDRFKAWRYDIGEAIVGEGTEFERHGKIVPFDESLHIYRIDAVDDAKENSYNLKGIGVKKSFYDDSQGFKLPAGEKLAITGVLRPYQLEPSDFKLKDNNEYDIANYPEKLVYTFRPIKPLDGQNPSGSVSEPGGSVERKLGMLRYKDGPLEGSVFEFYNIFEIPKDYSGKSFEIQIEAFDKKGCKTPCKNSIIAEFY